MFAPIVILFALASPEGIQGLFRLRGRARLDADPRAASRRGRRPSSPITRRARDARSRRSRSSRSPSSTSASARWSWHSDINLEVYPYQLHSLIGPNGAGKTTFFNMLTGLLPPDAGTIVFDGHDITRLPVHKRIRARAWRARSRS